MPSEGDKGFAGSARQEARDERKKKGLSKTSVAVGAGLHRLRWASWSGGEESLAQTRRKAGSGARNPPSVLLDDLVEYWRPPSRSEGHHIRLTEVPSSRRLRTASSGTRFHGSTVPRAACQGWRSPRLCISPSPTARSFAGFVSSPTHGQLEAGGVYSVPRVSLRFPNFGGAGHAERMFAFLSRPRSC